ncbi:ComEA family DNA-binding protein [Algisphaera agarilytica]|uniref:Competence ComEA-like helix-hairpin-helix protein n=1 Tax=Algisphaera agarilytica TaxID=1385975 RepID=A0A7X0H8B2_9BACT|nr:helix-hairpin-helix domain-containing protein [Algisphaera agarilytica]MBB6430897.1 competence ComEA-like helix-hairpin-helix protein [Algisphaera agarilytica]
MTTNLRSGIPRTPHRHSVGLAIVLLFGMWGGVTGWRLFHLPSAGPHVARGPGFRIDINRADTATLQLLPGVGPSLAENVIEYRETVGPFQDAADLEQVQMIGPVLRQRIEPWVTVEQSPQRRSMNP